VNQNGSAPSSGIAGDTEQRVRRALEHVKPYLLVDGGSVELVRIDYVAHVVEVCLVGACKTCSLSMMTLRAGIERAILHEAPEIHRVEAVSNTEMEQAFDYCLPSMEVLLNSKN
jgi:Fe-S cluster biogenesis protein NfuA